MGTVYEAADTALERRVAVKVIREDRVGSADAAERFRLEARATASFAHPNVVTVYDFGVAADTRAFLVMELLDGNTLREVLLRQKRLPAARALEILRGVCAAVEAAHRRKLVHRDLKPENIFLARTESGEVTKVLDFGIAKLLPTGTEGTADTGKGMLVGTLAYMSPEQVRGEAVQPAWDVWALAVIAFEMLTGARPFSGASMLSGPATPVSKYLPDSPASWQDFFARALAIQPSNRPGSASVFFSELQHAIT
jgi:serine/threonine-protein kinase